MNRKSFLHSVAFLGLGAAIRPSSLGSLLFQSYKITPLRGGVSIFTERGGTIAFIDSAELSVVIDSQFPDTSAHLVEELSKNGHPAISYLLNTHHHGDHSSGNIAWKGVVKHVVAHANSAANQKAAAEKANTMDKQLLPDQTYTDELKLKLANEKITGYYWGAGHTNGDSIYHIEEANIMHLGDLLFNKRHPFVDRSTGASITNWIQILEKVEKKADKDTLFVFGHSLNPGEETGSVDRVKAFRNYLQQVLDHAQKSVKEGMTKEAFIATKEVPGNTEWSGNGIERPLGAAWEEVMAMKK